MDSPVDIDLSEAIILFFGGNPLVATSYFPDKVLEKFDDAMLARLKVAIEEFRSIAYSGSWNPEDSRIEISEKISRIYVAQRPEISLEAIRLIASNFFYEN